MCAVDFCIANNRSILQRPKIPCTFSATQTLIFYFNYNQYNCVIFVFNKAFLVFGTHSGICLCLLRSKQSGSTIHDSGGLFHFPLDGIAGEYSIVQLCCFAFIVFTKWRDEKNAPRMYSVHTIKTDTIQFIITHLDKVATANGHYGCLVNRAKIK